MSVTGKRVALVVPGIMLLAAIMASAFPSHGASAAQITQRSLTLEAGAGGDAGGKPGGTVNHFFQFTVPASAATIGSIKFQYCTTASGTCVLPGDAGNGNVVNTTAATLDFEGPGTGTSGFTMVNTTNGEPYLTRTPAVAIGDGSTPQQLSYRFGNVVNPSDLASPNLTFYVRISTYTSTDATTGVVDTGTVAAATSTQIILTGTMPESLIFCTGQTVGVNGAGIPDCSTATAGNISFNRLFSPSQTAYATSQMAASTNALFGYTITVNGPTLTSGTNNIPAIGGTAATAVGTVGTSKFGMNVVHDTDTDSLTGLEILNPLSADVNPGPDGTFLMGKAAANFDTDGAYAFDDTAANVIAKSDNGTGTSAPTDSQIFTSTYMVNVAGHQVAGTYTTTLTYICTPTF